MDQQNAGQGEIFEILRQLVIIDSVSGRETAIAQHIRQFLLRLGFQVYYQEVEPGRNNIFARKGNPRLLFFGHMDTVAPVDSWTKHPFDLTVEDDKAYGLGTWDMKGGIAAILAAAQVATDMAILITVDEEEVSKGSWKAIENRLFFNGIIGIISAEAGNEPGTYGGATHLAYGRQGRKAFHISKNLAAGHAATAKQGDWASWIHSKIDGMPKTNSRIVVRNFSATSRGLSMPDRIDLDVDVLVHPSEKNTDFQKIITDHFDALAVLKKRETPYLEPYTCQDHEFVNRVAEIVRKNVGPPTFHLGSSVGDENVLAVLGIPIVIIGPEGRNEHKADEWVSVSSLNGVASLYVKLLQTLK